VNSASHYTSFDDYVVSGQLVKVLDDFEKSLLSALDQFIAMLHSDLHKASVSADTLLRVGRQHRSTVTAKVSYICNQGAYRSWKVMEFKIEIFQAWKVMESDLGSGKSWKINHKLNCEHYGLLFFDSDLVTNPTHFCNI